MLQSQPPPPPVHWLPQPPPPPLDVPIITASLNTGAGFFADVQARTALASAVVMPVAAIATAEPAKRGRGRPRGSRDKVPRTKKCDLTQLAQNASVQAQGGVSRKYGDPLPPNKQGVFKFYAAEMSFQPKPGEHWQPTLSPVNEEHREFLQDGFVRKMNVFVGAKDSKSAWTSPVDLVRYAGLAKSRAWEVSTRQYLEGGLDAHGKRDPNAPPPIDRKDIIELWTGEQNNSNVKTVFIRDYAMHGPPTIDGHQRCYIHELLGAYNPEFQQRHTAAFGALEGANPSAIRHIQQAVLDPTAEQRFMQGGASGGAAGGAVSSATGGAIMEQNVEMQVEENEKTGGRTESVRREQMLVSDAGIETRGQQVVQEINANGIVTNQITQVEKQLMRVVNEFNEFKGQMTSRMDTADERAKMDREDVKAQIQASDERARKDREAADKRAEQQRKEEKEQRNEEKERAEKQHEQMISLMQVAIGNKRRADSPLVAPPDLEPLSGEEQEGGVPSSAAGSAMAISSLLNSNPLNVNSPALREKAVAQVLPSFNEVSAALSGAAGEDVGRSSSEAPAVPIAAIPKPIYRTKAKPIYRIDIRTGEVIKKFASMNEAATELQIDASRISEAVRGLKYNEKSQIKKGHDEVAYQWALVHPTEPFPGARSATPPLPDPFTVPTQAEKDEIGKWIARDSTVDPNGSYYLLTLKEVQANFYMDIARDERMYNVDKFRPTSVNPSGSIKAHIAEACMLAVMNKDLPPKKQKEELEKIEYLAYTKKKQIKMMGPEKGVKGYKFTFA